MNAAESQLLFGPAPKRLTMAPELAARLASTRGGHLDALIQGVSPFALKITPDDDGLRLSGDDPACAVAARVLETAAEALRATGRLNGALEPPAIDDAIDALLRRDLAVRAPGLPRPVRMHSLAQLAYARDLFASEPPLVIASGPTGTGKTHLALAAGVSRLAQGACKRLVIARPHVIQDGDVVTAEVRADIRYDVQFEAIEDALGELVGAEETARLRAQRQLEILPVGRLQGRTFSDAFILIDEAQNMTVRRMRMALGRLGERSRMVVTGDPVHVELKEDEPSGFAHLLDMVDGEDFAAVHRFQTRQIMRNPVVARLEALYAAHPG